MSELAPLFWTLGAAACAFVGIYIGRQSELRRASAVLTDIIAREQDAKYEARVARQRMHEAEKSARAWESEAQRVRVLLAEREGAGDCFDELNVAVASIAVALIEAKRLELPDPPREWTHAVESLQGTLDIGRKALGLRDEGEAA